MSLQNSSGCQTFLFRRLSKRSKEHSSSSPGPTKNNLLLMEEQLHFWNCIDKRSSPKAHSLQRTSGVRTFSNPIYSSFINAINSITTVDEG